MIHFSVAAYCILANLFAFIYLHISVDFYPAKIRTDKHIGLKSAVEIKISFRLFSKYTKQKSLQTRKAETMTQRSRLSIQFTLWRLKFHIHIVIFISWFSVYFLNMFIGELRADTNLTVFVFIQDNWDNVYIGSNVNKQKGLTEHYSTALNSKVQHRTVQYSIEQYSTA